MFAGVQMLIGKDIGTQFVLDIIIYNEVNLKC